MTLPANKLVNLRRRVNRARKWPENTCPASRHLQQIADYIAGPQKHPLADMWEAEHMAETMYAVLEALWKLRTKLKETP